MAQNIGPLQGAYFSAVPAVDLPKQGGGTATFTDVTDTTATASDVAAGKYFYTAAGVLTEGTSTGGGGGFVDVVETLPNGGQHHKISGVDLSNDTVTAAHLETGYTAHDAEGNAITGTLVPGGGGATLITKSITANGTYNASSDGADGYSSVTVNVSGGGGGTSEPRKDVNFFDYDGTILHSYTAQEALALNSLPSNPSHSGLTAQGWNYTLAEMKTEVNAVGKCDIGQMYITASGDTEIDVSFPSALRLSPILTIAVNGTITVDWGDNTTADTVTGTSLTTRTDTPHTYASAGDYTIVIHVVSGEFQFYGGSSNYSILRKSTTAAENTVYTNTVKAIRAGSGMKGIDSYGLYQCFSLEYITLPSGVTTIINYGLSYCYSLKAITIPSEVTEIGSNALNNCRALFAVSFPPSLTTIGNNSVQYPYSMPTLTIPSSVTRIEASGFNYCQSLAEVTIPSGITYLGNSAFGNCRGVKEYHVLPTTPPTLGTDVFTNIPSDCVIYVPSASLSAYQTAWSSYASRIQGE